MGYLHQNESVRFASEWFSLTLNLRNVISFEFWCYRKILKISWKDKITNEAVLEKCIYNGLFYLMRSTNDRQHFFVILPEDLLVTSFIAFVESTWRKVGKGRR